MIHFFLLFSLTFSGVESLGINYGQVGDNLPPPDKVLELLTSLKISKVRIYDTNPQILATFANSKTELIVTIENEMLSQLMDPQQALEWVATHIKPYFPASRITGIAVGNEIFTGNDTVLMSNLVPAMINIHSALAQLGLGSYIHVSTPTSLAVLENSFPPSAETGWPSKGDYDEIGATAENAAIYNRNLLRRQLANEGTPLRPNMRLEVYLFALFNEDMKPGPTSERNYGLYQPDGTMAYNVGLSALLSSSSSTSSSASISLSSSATKTISMEYKSLAYWMFAYLVISLEIILTRRPLHLED
ncbi:glucan endo-1,3-beta-glucosidase 11-like isoform X2 [Cucumis melo]|uniref:glucan endo-1,3-beta-D-glucosidase n=1 Tax=Cucumis melo TaxID=3656 RepID=A0A1S3AZ76_CUCME|nr:glucan endo-1,3-beta-glucosidase 11-like isoform X2 [Cucumis melo]